MLSGLIPHSRPLLGDAERDAVLSTLERGWVGAGGEIAERFSDEIAAYLGRAAAVPVSSGTAALEIALRIIGVEGDAVAVPAFSCASIERAIVRAGGIPHLVDVDPNDLSFPLDQLESLSEICVALVLVHQFGVPARCAPAARNLRAAVVEDVTTGLGGTLGDHRVGTFGQIAALSMSATKMLCAGEGGAIAGEMPDIDLAQQWLDPESALPPEAPVFNAKLSAVAAALASVQLRRLRGFIARRSEIASYYDAVLGERSHRVIRPLSRDRGTWWRYLVALPAGEPTAVIERANAKGIRFARPVPERRWASRGRFPVSDRLHASLISVPIYPSLTDGEVERVADTLAGVIP